MPPTEKLSHEEVDYGPGHKDGDHCSICTHFIRSGPHCKLVEDPIKPMDWCKRFSPMRNDDAQHMGFTGEGAKAIETLVSGCDALEKRLDMFEKRYAMRHTKEVKPRTKDNMQPSNRHPKEVHKVK